MDKRDILIQFRDKIQANKAISRGDVISLEALIGDNLITKEIHPNSFPEQPIGINVDRSLEIVNKEIDNLEVAPLTSYDIITNLRELERDVDLMLSRLKVLSPYATRLTEALSSNDLKFFYDKEKNLKDSNSESFLHLIVTHDEWLRHLLNILDRSYDNIPDILDATRIQKGNGEYVDIGSITIAPIISILNNSNLKSISSGISNFQATNITVGEVIKFLSRIDDAIIAYEEMLEVLKEDINRVEQGKVNGDLSMYHPDNYTEYYTNAVALIRTDNYTRAILIILIRMLPDKALKEYEIHE